MKKEEKEKELFSFNLPLKNRKGLSAIVATLIIILLVLVAAGIIWVVIRNIISEGAEEIELGRFTFDLSIKSAYIDGTNVKVIVRRSPGGGDLIGVKFIFFNSTDSISVDRKIPLVELQEKLFSFNSSEVGDINALQEVSVVPIYELSSGRETVGDIIDTVTISGSSPPGGNGDNGEPGNGEPNNFSGNVIHAASGNPSDIQAAVDSASIGDIVQIPEGDFLFDGTVTIPAGIHLKGAGRDKTILRKTGTSTMLKFDCSNGEQIQFSEIKLIGREGALDWDRGLDLRYGCEDFRVFDSEFEGFGHAGIIVRGNARGVIDNNNFIDNYYPGLGYGIEIIGDGNASWERPLELGTQNAVFVEDNYFSGCRHGVASSYGSRYVFRYNTIDGYGGHPIDAHGPSGSWTRGSRSYEIYNNVCTYSGGSPFFDMHHAIGIRGGDGVIYNNDVTEYLQSREVILLYLDYRAGEGCDPNDAGTSYPCPDQVRSCYIWNNIDNGEPVTAVYIRSNHQWFIQEDRDYFMYQKPGYTSYVYPHPLRGS